MVEVFNFLEVGCCVVQNILSVHATEVSIFLKVKQCAVLSHIRCKRYLQVKTTILILFHDIIFQRHDNHLTGSERVMISIHDFINTLNLHALLEITIQV